MAVRAYNAAVDGVGCVRELVVGEKGDPVTITCSSADGAFLELNGTKDWEGHYSAYGGYANNGGSPNSYPNGTFTLAFNINQDVDEGGSGPAIVEAVRVDWDFVKNWPIMHVVKFAGTGASAFAWGAQTTSDATTPSPLPSRDGKIQVADAAAAPSYADVPKVLKASLTVFSDIEPYADSDSSYGKQRVAGPVGWKVNLDVHADDPSIQETLNGDSMLKMFIDDTNYWDVQFVKWKKIGDLRVVIDGREYVTSQFEGAGTGYVDISGTWTKGQLVDPNSTTIWD